MEVWILFNEEIEAPTAEAFEIRRFLAEGREMGIDVKVFHPEQFDLLVTADDKESVLIDGNLVALPDFQLPRTPPVESGYFAMSVIRQLKKLGVRTYNDAACIEMVADKLHTHQVLIGAGLPTPTTMLAKFPIDTDLIESTIGFPIVVKTLLGVNGTGVFLMETREAFEDLMGLIAETNPNIQLIFQKFIAKSKGRDIRLFVLNGQVIGAMERRAKDGGFKANFSQGGSVEAIIPDQDAIDLAIKTAEVLDIQVAGIDLLYTEDGYTVCEANTFPGFRGLEQACEDEGLNVPREIFTHMLKELEGENKDVKSA
ncbi:MAG: RimK family alpha-L-glutamate ligase [Pseudomonadota bacterium]